VRRRSGGADEDGFTLIELMVVVLIIAILLAIAIPTFLGARERSADRAAQSTLRNAHTNAFVYYVGERQVFTEDVAALQALDPSITYTTDFSTLRTGPHIYVEAPPGGTSRPLDTIYLGARSGSGRCYWVRSIGDQNHPRYATARCNSLDATAPEAGLSWATSW